MIGRFIPSVVLSSDWPCQPVLSLHSLFNLTLDKTYPTSGSLRNLQAFSRLRVYTALKPSPHSAHLRVTQTVGRWLN